MVAEKGIGQIFWGNFMKKKIKILVPCCVLAALAVVGAWLGFTAFRAGHFKTTALLQQKNGQAAQFQSLREEELFDLYVTDLGRANSFINRWRTAAEVNGQKISMAELYSARVSNNYNLLFVLSQTDEAEQQEEYDCTYKTNTQLLDSLVEKAALLQELEQKVTLTAAQQKRIEALTAEFKTAAASDSTYNDQKNAAKRLAKAQGQSLENFLQTSAERSARTTVLNEAYSEQEFPAANYKSNAERQQAMNAARQSLINTLKVQGKIKCYYP